MHSRFFRGAVAALALGAVALSGCDSAAADSAADATAAADAAYFAAGGIDPADSVAVRLDRALGLTDAQVAIVSDVLGTREPGDLWRLAAALTPTLSDAQRAALDSVAVAGSGRGRRGARGLHGPRDSTQAGCDSTHVHGDSTRFDIDWEAVRAAEREARNEALDLTSAQAAALDSLGARSGHHVAANVVPDAVAAILDDAQEAIYLVHQELRAYLRTGHGPGGRGPGGGPGGGPGTHGPGR